MTRFEKFRARGADRRLAPRALTRRFGAFGGPFGFGRQRGDTLVEPRRALIEIAAPFAGLEVEQPRAAQEEVREPERAPQVERDRQCANDVEDLRRPVEPFAVGRDPVGDRPKRAIEATDGGDGPVPVQQANPDGDREGDDCPYQQPGLAAVGPDGAEHGAGAGARAEGRHVAHQMAIADVGVRSGEAEPAQPRLDHAPTRAGENVDPRARGLEQESVGEPGALGLDVVAVRAFCLDLPHQVVMTVGRRPRGAMRIAAGMAGLVEQGRIVDAAGLAIERGVGGAGDRHRRLESAPRVDMRHHGPPQRARRRSAEFNDRLLQAPQRECLAGARRPGDRGQKRGLDLRGDAKLGQRRHELRGAQDVSPVDRFAQENRVGLDGGGRRRDRYRRRCCLSGRPAGQRDRRLVARRDPAE